MIMNRKKYKFKKNPSLKTSRKSKLNCIKTLTVAVVQYLIYSFLNKINSNK